MEYQIEFTDKEITPWAGILMLKKMLDRMDFDGCIDTLNLPEQGSNRGYSSVQLIKQFITSLWCGANKFEHTEVTRQDEVIRQFWGFERMAGHKSFQRFFNKFDLATNQKVFTALYQWFFKHLQFNNLTLDVDITIHTRYGTQQAAKKGYNPKKPGRMSHHPLMAFVAESKMVANFWLRSGDTYTANNIESFLVDTFEKLGGLGHARLAVCTDRHRERGPERYLDLGYWADPHRSLYRPQWTVDELERTPNFT